MPKGVRKITKRFFIVLNIILVIGFLLACLNNFLDPAEWWFIAVLALAIPFLLVSLILFAVFWLLFRSKWAFLSLGAILLGFFTIRAVVGINFARGFSQEKEGSSIRVLTWNIHSWDEMFKKRKGNYPNRTKMLDYIRNQHADILCLQEFFESKDPQLYDRTASVLQEMGYPYYFFTNDYSRFKNLYESGSAIFSKYPILEKDKIRYRKPDSSFMNESLIYADVNTPSGTIRVFTTHLQSNNFGQKEYEDIRIIKSADDSLVEATQSLIKKLRRSYSLRSGQVEQAYQAMKASPHPIIFSGDLNDVPGSFTYFRLKGNRKDAFVSAGSGLGRTFRFISPTLRIDYVFVDDRFRVLQTKTEPIDYSDHFPIVTDLRLPAK